MKRAFLLLTTLSACSHLYAQTVENIHVETEGDRILIHYRIGESTEKQVYDVALTCSMDGGPRFEPVSVIGDVGQHILGGRSNYTITWNVFDDLEEVGDVEFFVKVSLADELSESDEKKDESQSGPFKKSTSQDIGIQNSAFIGFNGSTYSPFGLSGGSLNKYGFFGGARAGTNNDEFQNDIWVTIVAGFTIHAFSRGIYRLHGYAGVGTSIEYYEELETGISSTDPMFVAEGGLMHVVGRINLTTGLVFVTGYGLHFVYGVGFMF